MGQSGTLSAGSGAPGGTTTQAAQQKAPDRGSNFVGIKNYLDANKAQAGKLGDQAAGVIDNSANEARQGVTQLNDTFNQKAGTGVALDQNALGKVNQAETLNDQEKQTLKNQYNAQYQGPNSLNDLNDEYTQASQKLNKAQTNINSAGTEEGRKTLVTQINEKPRTAGITNFDSMLLQAGGGREKVEQAAQKNQDLTGNVLEQSNLAAQQKAADIKKQTDATRAATQSAVQQAQQGLQKQFDANDPNSKLYQAIQSALQKNNQIAQDLGDQSGFDEATMEMLGLNEGQKLYNLDVNKYFNQLDPNAITKESVASQEDLLRSQALAELMGGQSFLGDQGIGSYSQMNPLNAQAFKDDLTKREQELLPQYEQMNQDVSSAQSALDAFVKDPKNSIWGAVGQEGYRNKDVHKRFLELKQNIAEQEAARKKWEADTGFNNTAKRG